MLLTVLDDVVILIYGPTTFATAETGFLAQLSLHPIGSVFSLLVSHWLGTAPYNLSAGSLQLVRQGMTDAMGTGVRRIDFARSWSSW
jgi:hypothetical protein